MLLGECCSIVHFAESIPNHQPWSFDCYRLDHFLVQLNELLIVNDNNDLREMLRKQANVASLFCTNLMTT